LVLVERTTALADEIVATLVMEASEGKSLSDHAIVALGGYGRAELCPHSDVDLLFLVEDADDPAVHEWVNAVLYGLWDLSFEVGHAVRTGEDTLALAKRDQSVLTALLDARPIRIGDGGDDARVAMFRELMEALERDLFAEHRSNDLVAAKLEEAAKRRERFGNTIYLLEPNVKESEGGIRELHTAMWIAHARWRARSLRDLLHVGVLSSREIRAIERAYGFLLRVRSELHLAASRRQDILGFQHQETVARRLGYVSGSEKKAGIERFMRAYYFHARQLRIQSQSIVERATSHNVKRAKTRPAPGGFELWQEMLTVAKRSRFDDDPPALIEIFEIAQRESLVIYSYTKDLIATSKNLIDSSVRRSPRAVASFLSLLEDPKADGSVLDLMHDLGVLGRLIPEVRRMTARWQHSLYHVYTVDVHSIAVVKNLKRLRAGGFAESEPELSRLADGLLRPAVVYMAALLHDIGKGWRSGDHSERGAAVARRVGHRFEAAKLGQWTREDTEDLEWLVRRHLEMSTTSQRRDVSDRALLEAFAADVRTVERLEMLYLLTFADMKGTSPKVWTDWKSSLLSQLYHEVRIVLEDRTRGSELSVEEHEHARRVRLEEELRAVKGSVPAQVVSEFVRLMPARYMMTFRGPKMARHMRMWLDVSTHGGFAVRVSHKRRDDATELTIVCPDRPGLLSVLAGTLTANRMQILSAQIFSVDLLAVGSRVVLEDEGPPDYDLVGVGVVPRKTQAALDVLNVKDAGGTITDDPMRWEQVRQDLERVISAEKNVEELLETRARGSTLHRKHKPEVSTKMVITNDASRTETVIDVFCQDHLGALYTITNALADQGLTISLAKISTEGDRVADGFYVTEASTGRKVDPSRFDAIRDAVTRAIALRIDE
jgi:[protein-PII] uridylyltransferase